MMQPRHDLAVSSAGLTNDLRTLVINTAPMSSNVHYAVTVPLQLSASDASKSHIAQLPELDVDFALHGLQASWKPAKENDLPAWTGWLPHPDLNTSRKFLAGSAAHEPLWAALSTAGKLELRTRMNLNNILRPAIQPGASIDYEWPAEEAIVTFMCNRGIVVQAIRAGADKQPATQINVVCDQSSIERQQATFRTSADVKEPVDVVVEIQTGPAQCRN